MKHPGHTYGGFVPAISEWGMTDVWEPAHQGDTDAVERLVTISFYSYAIFVIFILNSKICRNAIQRS
jgi:hypothetical protein